MLFSVRVVAIEELASLSRAQLRLAHRCMYWPTDYALQRQLRAYRLLEGGVIIAPWNPAIEAEMEIVALGGASMAFEDYRGSRSIEVQCAPAVAAR
jgi:hypothetical protein